MNLFDVIEEAKVSLRNLEDELESIQGRASDIDREISYLKFTIKFVETRQQNSKSGNGALSGLSLIDAAVKALNMAETWVEFKELTSTMLDGGFQTAAKDPDKSVYGTLYRHCKTSSKPKVLYINKKFGLPDWATDPLVEEGSESEESERQ